MWANDQDLMREVLGMSCTTRYGFWMAQSWSERKSNYTWSA